MYPLIWQWFEGEEFIFSLNIVIVPDRWFSNSFGATTHKLANLLPNFQGVIQNFLLKFRSFLGKTHEWCPEAYGEAPAKLPAPAKQSKNPVQTMS